MITNARASGAGTALALSIVAGEFDATRRERMLCIRCRTFRAMGQSYALCSGCDREVRSGE
jgi:hypothetical protein